jgi:hypothetical protein
MAGGAGGGMSNAGSGTVVLSEAGKCGGNGTNTGEDLVPEIGHPNQGAWG